jgi:hypothetical protein
MSTPSFSPLTPRWCGWCQQPLQGRSDKQFCSAACRGKADRHGVVEGGPVDWPARAAHAEETVAALQAQLAQVAHERQTLSPLEQRYEEFTQLLHALVVHVHDVGLLTGILHYVTQLLGDYAQHPGLAKNEAAPQLRLRHLEQVQSMLQQQLYYLPRQIPPAAPGPAGITPTTS